MPYDLGLQCQGCAKRLLDDREGVNWCGYCILHKLPQSIMLGKKMVGIKKYQATDRLCSVCNTVFSCSYGRMFGGNIICRKCSVQRFSARNCVECEQSFNPVNPKSLTCSERCRVTRRKKIRNMAAIRRYAEAKQSS